MAINLDPFVAPNEITFAIDTLINQINISSNPLKNVVVKTDTATATLTAANLIAATDMVYISMTGATAGSTLTLDTVANLVAALQNKYGSGMSPIGLSWVVRVINQGGGNTWTLTTATGWTLSGTQTVATNTFRDFVLTITSLTAATWTQVGKGTTD